MYLDSYSFLYRSSLLTIRRIASYFENVFWLLAPILAINLMLTRRLPKPYQTETFWKEIPSWISTPENLFRIPVSAPAARNADSLLHNEPENGNVALLGGHSDLQHQLVASNCASPERLEHELARLYGAGVYADPVADRDGAHGRFAHDTKSPVFALDLFQLVGNIRVVP